MMVFINKRDVEARYRVVGAITRNKTRDYLRCGVGRLRREQSCRGFFFLQLQDLLFRSQSAARGIRA